MKNTKWRIKFKGLWYLIFFLLKKDAIHLNVCQNINAKLHCFFFKFFNFSSSLSTEEFQKFLKHICVLPSGKGYYCCFFMKWGGTLKYATWKILESSIGIYWSTAKNVHSQKAKWHNTSLYINNWVESEWGSIIRNEMVTLPTWNFAENLAKYFKSQFLWHTNYSKIRARYYLLQAMVVQICTPIFHWLLYMLYSIYLP